MQKAFTLRRLMEENKAWYLQRHGKLNWRWHDEGLPYTILDWHSCTGSLDDFSADDFLVCEENGWTRAELEELCENEEEKEDVIRDKNCIAMYA